LLDESIVNVGDWTVKTDACATAASSSNGVKENNMVVGGTVRGQIGCDRIPSESQNSLSSWTLYHPATTSAILLTATEGFANWEEIVVVSVAKL
jgi:hypothetical protein